MKLTSTDKIQVVLSSAVALGELEMTSFWFDVETTNFGVSGFGNNAIDSHGTTLVDLIGSPTSGNVRTVEEFSIYCADTAIVVVNIYFNRNGTSKLIKKAYLSLGDSLIYSKDNGFDLQRTYQSIKSFSVHADAGVNWTLSNATLAERLAGNTSRSIFMLDLEGYTQVRLRANQQVTSASANTPILRAKYYTSWTTTAANFIQLGKAQQVEISLTGTGYRDTGWIELADAVRTNGICIAFLESGGDGVADPAFGATDILFR